MPAGEDAVADVALLGRGYYDNATDNPHLYRVMFMEEPLDEADAAARTDTFEVLVAAMQRCIDTGRFAAADPSELATQFWALGHSATHPRPHRDQAHRQTRRPASQCGLQVQNEPYRQMTPTASPKLELVKSIANAWERGDYSCIEWADAEIEFVIADGPEPGRWTGRAGLAPSLMDFRDAWEEYKSRAEEYRELDDGVLDDGVLVLTYASGRGRTSGVEIAGPRANLFRVRDGKVKSLVVYWDRERALADVGLSAQAA